MKQKLNLFKLTLIMSVGLSTAVYGQVGINTQSPEATLDIRGKNHEGAVTATDGVLIPRVNALSTNGSVNGQLVYLVTDAGSFAKGFYYWDGTYWTLVGADSTNDAWVNDNTNGVIKLGSKSDGNSLRPAETEFNIKDNGQVSIGTSSPDESAILDIASTTRGFLPPRMTTAQRDAIIAPTPGLIIFNTTKLCTEVYVSSAKMWYNYCDFSYSNVKPGVISGLDCASAIFSSNLYSSSPLLTGVTITVPYTGGDGGVYNAQSVYSTGVTGVVATLNPGTFAFGSGSLVYNLSGVPSGAGTINFPLSVTGLSCNVTKAVSSGGTIATLMCSSVTRSGTLYAGYASTATVSVPYTGGDGGPYVAQTINSTGVTGLTATLAASNLNNGVGSLTYNITGTPSAYGTANFAISVGGKTCTFTYPVVAYTSCKNYLNLNPGATDGVYKIDPDGGGSTTGLIDCHCDMTTDGGGWTLVMNYLHGANKTIALNARTNTLPLLNSSTLGNDENGTIYWGNTAPSLLSLMAFTEVQFYGKMTGNSGRIVHFKTNHANSINYFRSGIGSCTGIQNNFTAFFDHTSPLPGQASYFWANQGTAAMTYFPFMVLGTYHYGLYADWADVDTYQVNKTQSVLLRAWVR